MTIFRETHMPGKPIQKEALSPEMGNLHPFHTIAANNGTIDRFFVKASLDEIDVTRNGKLEVLSKEEINAENMREIITNRKGKQLGVALYIWEPTPPSTQTEIFESQPTQSEAELPRIEEKPLPFSAHRKPPGY